MSNVMVGDEVVVRGTVIEVKPGVGVVVEFFSKTDQWRGWVREDLVEVVMPAGLPKEPADGTWLRTGPDADEPSVFHRDDAEGHSGGNRRFDEHWWDFHAGQWIDWPTAHRRGADPSRRLSPVRERKESESHDPALR